MKSGDAIVADFLGAFDYLKIHFMLVGSFSSNFYGVPRSTEGADFVIQLESFDLLHKLCSALGENYKTNFQKSFEFLTATEKFEFTVTESRFRVELFLLGNDAHDLSRFGRRIKTSLKGKTAYLPTAEDVIITKLRWMRDKDRSDVRNVIAVQQESLDWKYIERWCLEHGTLNMLNSLRQASS